MVGGEAGEPEVVATGSLPVLGHNDEVLRAEGELLLRGGEEALGRLGHREELVGVDTDAEDRLASTGSLGDLDQSTISGVSAGAEDDVVALLELLLRLSGAPLGIVEGVVGLVVDERHLGGGVGGKRASLVALAEELHRWDRVGAEHGADLVGLGHETGEVTGGVAGLVLREDQSGQVGDLLGLELVHADELDARVGLGSLDGRLTHEEADRDDDVIPTGNELTDVGGVVLGIDGLDVLRVTTRGLGSLEGTLPCGLVERLVVYLAGVGDETDAERISAGAIALSAAASGTARRLAASSATAAGGQHERSGGSCSCQTPLAMHVHALSSWLSHPHVARLRRSRWVSSVVGTLVGRSRSPSHASVS